MRRRTTVLATSIVITASSPVMAYLDPGTGSLILQMLIAGALAALFYIRFAWDRTRDFLARIFGGRSNRAEATDDPPHPVDEKAPDGVPDDSAR